jgi:hypothetical protein
MSSAESTLVGAFSFDVVVKTCKFVDCVPFSEQLSCKIYRGNQVVSGEALQLYKESLSKA